MADKSALKGELIRDRSLVVFALGGSGIRALEPLVHLCAFGLGPRKLSLVLIDPDQANAAVGRVRSVLDAYRQVRESFGGGQYFRTAVVEESGRTPVWSPIADDEFIADARFASRVDRARMLHEQSAGLGLLFDLLYGDRIQDMDLAMGFRGVPSIGTVFMNRLRDEPYFQNIITQTQTEDTLFFSIGSIFGGTGAAAFPVVGQALVDGIQDDRDQVAVPGIPRGRIGGALLLPYFTLPLAGKGQVASGEVRPHTALFAQNAAAAIPAYAAGQCAYSQLYVLGDDQPREQEVNAVGGKGQKNRSHYIELFAALAALDFTARSIQDRGKGQRTSFRVSAVSGRNIGWQDLPVDTATRSGLMAGVVALETIRRHFSNERGPPTDLAARFRGMTWLSCLGSSAEDLDEQAASLEALGRYFGMVKEWLADMHHPVSHPSLELVRSTDGAAVGLDSTLRGWRARRTWGDDYDIFRYWDVAAHARRGQGLSAFLEVLRTASESMIDDGLHESAVDAS